MAPDNDDCGWDPPNKVSRQWFTGKVYVVQNVRAYTGADSDGLPRDWLEGVTLDYYWAMNPGTLQGHPRREPDAWAAVRVPIEEYPHPPPPKGYRYGDGPWEPVSMSQMGILWRRPMFRVLP